MRYSTRGRPAGIKCPKRDRRIVGIQRVEDDGSFIERERLGCP